MKKISNTYTALICLFLVIRWVSANVEKVIFLGPSPTLLPDDYPNLAQLGLHELFSSRSSVRNYLPASFPREEKPEGDETWVLLDGLEKGRRYEVRICWAATQPTRFRLVTHTIEEVFTTPSLISSVTAVSELRLSSIQPSRLSDEQRDREREPPNALLRSVLLLQVFAAADYYSSNTSLMQNVPPVHVDIIGFFRPLSTVDSEIFVLRLPQRARKKPEVFCPGMASDSLPDSVPSSPSSESQASPSIVPSIIASSDALPEYSGEGPNGDTFPSTEGGAEGFNFAGTAPSVVSAPPYPGAPLVGAPIPTGDHFIIAHPITADAIHPAVLDPTPRNLTLLLYPEDLEDSDQAHRPLLPLFNSLPPEMVLYMMSYLQPLHLINFLFAEYDLLCQFMVVDKFTARYLGTLLSPCTIRPRLRPLVGIERIPTELLLQIMGLLNAADLANLVFAGYQLMEARGLAPSLSRGMASQFWIAEHRKLTIDAAHFTLVDGVVIRKPSVDT